MKSLIFNDVLFSTLFIASALIFMMILSIVKIFFISKKRSAKSIYKLIDDLEKKYIY